MVLLPHKYLQSKIPNHAKFSGEAAVKGGPVAQHEVTLEEQAIIDNWEHERMLCSSPQVIDGSPCLETGRHSQCGPSLGHVYAFALYILRSARQMLTTRSIRM